MTSNETVDNLVFSTSLSVLCLYLNIVQIYVFELPINIYNNWSLSKIKYQDLKIQNLTLDDLLKRNMFVYNLITSIDMRSPM